MNREEIKKAFKEYTDRYDASDGKIMLKIEHTYRVAELSDRICKSLELCKEDTDTAWLIAMLHDIGRFEQVRRFGTFADAQSVDHAELSVDLFVNHEIMDAFYDFEPEENAAMIEAAIRAHNKYRIPSNYDERTILFSKIIRDADKIDILKVNVEIPQEVIYNVSTEELRDCYVSEAVMNSFYEEHCVLRSLKQTPIDNLIGHLSLIYELEFPVSYSIVKEQGYYLKAIKIMENSLNPKTRELTQTVKERIVNYINRHEPQNMV